MFDPGGSTGHLRACSVLGTWRALLCGEVFVRALNETAARLGGWMTRNHHRAGKVHRRIVYAVRIAVDPCFYADRLMRGTVN